LDFEGCQCVPVQERGNAYLIGVDTDLTVSAPEYTNITLTSILKNMDVAVFNAARQVQEGTFKGGLFVGALENDGVGVAPFHELESMVSDEVKAELEQIREGIIAGEIKTSP
jgi:basic membrane protein A